LKREIARQSHSGIKREVGCVGGKNGGKGFKKKKKNQRFRRPRGEEKDETTTRTITNASNKTFAKQKKAVATLRRRGKKKPPSTGPRKCRGMEKNEASTQARKTGDPPKVEKKWKDMQRLNVVIHRTRQATKKWAQKGVNGR